MMKQTIMYGLSMALGLMLTAAAASAATVNVAVNGGFETGDFSGWTQFPSGTQTVGGFAPTEGAFAAELLNNNPGSASLIKNANIGIGVVTPVAPVTISFDARGATNAGGVAFAEFFSELSGGGVSATEILGGAPLALNADPAAWTSFTFNTITGPDVSGGVTLQLTATTGADPSSSAQIFYDNVRVSVAGVVPEPGSLAVLCLGSVGIVLRRRR